MTGKLADGLIVIAAERDQICEQCGRLDETRPYGARLESGRRKRLCFGCAMLSELETGRAFKEFLK